MTGGPQPVEETADPGHVRWLAILTAVVIFSLWVMPLFSSLWLDELGTWWVVKDGARRHRRIARSPSTVSRRCTT